MSLLVWSAAALAGSGVVFVGDTGTGRSGQHRVAAAITDWCAAHPCDALLLLGDNFYPSGISGVDDAQLQTKFEAVYGHLGVPVHPVLGNHDRAGSVRAQLRYASQAWQMPARYYTLSLDGIDLIALDSTRLGCWQRRWLRRALAQSTAEVVAVYAHHPAYAYGTHGDTDAVKQHIVPLLPGQADLYLSGHEHSLQALDAGDGVRYLVAGSGGKVAQAGRGERTLFAASLRGFGYLSVDEDGAVVQLISADGAVVYEEALPTR